MEEGRGEEGEGNGREKGGWRKVGKGRRERRKQEGDGERGETPVAMHFKGVDLSEYVRDPENNVKSSHTFLHVLILLRFCLKRQQISVVFLGSSFQN